MLLIKMAFLITINKLYRDMDEEQDMDESCQEETMDTVKKEVEVMVA